MKASEEKQVHQEIKRITEKLRLRETILADRKVKQKLWNRRAFLRRKLGEEVPPQVKKRSKVSKGLRSSRVRAAIFAYGTIARAIGYHLHRPVGDDNKDARYQAGSRGLQRLGISSRQALIRHLESLFKPGMSWGNYREVWSVSRSTSTRGFFYTGTEDREFRRAWGLLNLLPVFRDKDFHLMHHMSVKGASKESEVTFTPQDLLSGTAL